MWTSCINQIKQINGRLDNECSHLIENKMLEMVKNYVFLNKELLEEIEKEENTKEIESFFSVNSQLIRDLGQKYIEIIGEIINYKIKRSDDLYQKMHEIAKKNNLSDDMIVNQENQNNAITAHQNDGNTIGIGVDDSGLVTDESTESDPDIVVKEESNDPKELSIDDPNKFGLYEPCINLRCPISDCEDKDLFEFYVDFEDHMEIFHGDTKPYKCHQCGTKCGSKGEYIKHIKRIHKRIKHFECDVCQKQFYNKTDWKRHYRVHTGERPYKCNQCDMSFKENGHLASHIKHIHCNKRPFQCFLCNKSFKSEWNLKSHIRNAHNKEIRFKCKYCNKGFFNKSSWLVHCRIHTGEKPFECKACNKKFRAKHELKAHEETHFAEKRFQCKKCHKAFQRSHSRRRHEKKCN